MASKRRFYLDRDGAIELPELSDADHEIERLQAYCARPVVIRGSHGRPVTGYSAGLWFPK